MKFLFLTEASGRTHVLHPCLQQAFAKGPLLLGYRWIILNSVISSLHKVRSPACTLRSPGELVKRIPMARDQITGDGHRDWDCMEMFSR